MSPGAPQPLATGRLAPARPKVLYAISAHGFGHATRSLAVARQLLALRPDLSIVYSTAVPRDFLIRSGARPDLPAAGGKPPRESLRLAPYEPGTAEKTCFEVDVERTRAAYRAHATARQAMVDAEAGHLRECGYAGVVSDVAVVPIAAAARVGIPSVAISNFTWDWILDPLLRGDDRVASLPALLAADYRSARAYLRLPFHPQAHPFDRVIDLPLVGRKAEHPAGEVRTRLGLPARSSRPLVLVSIGGLRAGDWPVIRPDAGEVDLLVVGRLPMDLPPGGRFLPEALDVGFADLVGAADAVLAKPGYGICSECAANGTPLVAVERLGFAEADPLREGVSRLIPYRDLPLADFFAGRWSGALEEVLAAGRAGPAPPGGAREAARRIVEVLGI